MYFFLILQGNICSCFANIHIRLIISCEMCCKICNFLFPPDLHHPASRWCVSHSVAYVTSFPYNTVPILTPPLRIKVYSDKLLCLTGALSAVHLRYTDGTNVHLSVVHLQVSTFSLLYVKLFRSCVYQRFHQF